MKTPPRRASIGAHLVGLVILQLVLVWGMIGFGAREDFTTARNHAQAEAQAAVPLAADFVAQEVADTYESLAELPSVVALIKPEVLCEQAAASDEEDVRWFHSRTYILRTDGSSVCETTANQRNVGDEPWFKKALESEGPVTTKPLIDPISGERGIIYAVQLPASQMVLALSLEFDSIGPALDNQFGYGLTPPRFVVTSEDRTIEIGSSGAKTGRALEGTPFARKLTNENTFEDLDGVERIYAESTVPDLGWHVLAGVSTNAATAAATNALRERIMFGITIALLLFAAAFVLQRRFVRPVRSLLEATTKFGEDGSRSAVVPGGPSELKKLGESFNHMMAIRAAAERALRKAVDAEQRAASELREIDGMRQAFLMAISHELRTPLTSVVGYSTLLHEDGDMMSEKDRRQSIEAIATQSRRLERLLLDLLDVERLSRGVVEPNRRETNVRNLVDQVLDVVGADERVKAVVTGPSTSNVDPALVERIIENLLRNAMKHTPDGTRIWLRAARKNGHLSLKVEDAGPGVPDDLKLRIFEAFEQGEVPEHAPGTGVGLALVSQFAKLHGGRAWVEDRKGGGASFQVDLPAA